ncbi:MAG: adenylate/guanylate cyclase domain-containing protein [Candidatus Riflebacteria bacterium]|nr:adenylate/guanylate cyclase domain-containing protein [Candidatus Riflebacteria bacterium]
MKTNREIAPFKIQWNNVSNVILFGDISNYFLSAKNMTQSQLAEFLSGYYSYWRSEIFRQKGEIVSMLGDQILAVFRPGQCGGADPEWCAALAAFHLMKDLKKWRDEIELNVGINSGEILEGVWEENSCKKSVFAGNLLNKTAIMATGKVKGIIAGKAVVEILGPRVVSEKSCYRFATTGEEIPVYRLISLKL